jgi:hypothetical protein
MGENGGSVRFNMLVKPEAGSGLGQDGSERSLAHLKRVSAQVVTVQLDEVEGIEEDARVVPPVADAIEARDAVVAAGDASAILLRGLKELAWYLLSPDMFRSDVTDTRMGFRLDKLN